MTLPFDSNGIGRVCVSGTLAIAVVSMASAAATPSFMGLGYLHPQGSPSVAFGVSGDGSVVVGRSRNSTVNGRGEAFRWTEAAGMVSLGDLPGGDFNSQAISVSADGLTIVGSGRSVLSGSFEEAMRWTQATGMTGLGFLPGGWNSSSAADVSADGSTIVGYSHSQIGDQAFRWTPQDGMMSLGIADSSATGVSDDGNVIVGSVGTPRRPFRWSAQMGFQNLGLPPNGAISGIAEDVSADGATVVGWTRKPVGDLDAFAWQEGSGYEMLGYLPGDTESAAQAASADGSRIVGYSRRIEFRAVLWDGANGIRDLKQMLEADFELNLTGWNLISAYAISNDGNTIVGDAYNPNGLIEAYRAVIPEPASALLALASLAFCLTRRRH